MKNYERLRKIVYGILYPNGYKTIGNNCNSANISLQDILLAINKVQEKKIYEEEVFSITTNGNIYLLSFGEAFPVHDIDIDLTKLMNKQKPEIYTSLINLLK